MNPQSAREHEIWVSLAGVMDPELDESVTELNFVTGITVDAENRVHIGFRLPTYWCAANFAFLMADDMRRAALSVPWVGHVDVELGEHMYAETINAGLSKGLSFQQTFGKEADGDLEDLRQTFLIKAFQRRQVALLQHLLTMGFAAGELVQLRIGELAEAALDPEGDKLRQRYLDRRAVVGPPCQEALAFITAEGARLTADALGGYVSRLRRVGVNVEFNSALCRGLLSVRFDLETPFVPKSKLTPQQTAP